MGASFFELKCSHLSYYCIVWLELVILFFRALNIFFVHQSLQTIRRIADVLRLRLLLLCGSWHFAIQTEQ